MHEGLEEIVDQANRDRNLLPCQLAPYSAAYYAARQVSKDVTRTDTFFVEQMVNTIGLTSGSPALATRKYLLGLREDKRPNNKTAKAATVLALLEGYRGLPRRRLHDEPARPARRLERRRAARPARVNRAAPGRLEPCVTLAR